MSDPPRVCQHQEMQVRFPAFDFRSSSPAWGANREAVAIINAGAIIPPAIERYMIRVMRRARQALDPVADADLLADIDVFNKQEGQHHKLHASYLNMLRDGGFPRIVEFEAAFIADLERFLATESLAWNLSYCEGFESQGAAMAEAFVDGHVQALCGDEGSVPMQLWMWHLAEEFEHRSVVHDVLHRLYGPDEAYALRTAGATFNRSHLAEHTAVAAAYIYEVDREGMTPAEVEASVARETAAWIGMGEAFGDRLNWVFERDYDPGPIAAPRDYHAILARYAPA
jgi:predicted metal-dependent hydrolase